MNEVKARTGFNRYSSSATEDISYIMKLAVGNEVPRLVCPYEELPPIAQRAFLEIKRYVGAPDEVIFAWVLATMAAAVMRKACVKPPGRDADVLSLFFITASPSGTGKSPVYKILLKLFRAYDAERHAKYQEAAEAFEPDMVAWKAEKAGLSHLLTKLIASTKPENAERVKDIKERLKIHVRNKPPMPRYRRMVKTRADIDKILEALDGNREVLFLATDEGSKLLNGIVKKDPEDINKIFDGSEIVCDTKNVEAVITHPLATFSVNIQNRLLLRHLKKHGEDLTEIGLLPRTFISVAWDENDQEIDEDIEPNWDDVLAFTEMALGHLRGGDRIDAHGGMTPITITFDPEARKLYRDARVHLRELRLPGGSLHHVAAFVRKAPQLIARVAAIFFMFDEKQGACISETTLMSAIKVVGWYLSHAKYVLVDKPQRNDLERLVTLLRNCYADKCHRSRSRVDRHDVVPKNYIQQNLHMRVEVLDSLMALLKREGIAWYGNHDVQGACVYLSTEHFRRIKE